VADRRAVIIGASNIVGKPLALCLLHRDAVVTICHKYTRHLAPRLIRQKQRQAA
jgi:methylenetetrahydrofolate dehydrogenase (NADP+)/methenyltetrahydrofolate cyclohydrolase